jgi:hypothetical protein
MMDYKEIYETEIEQADLALTVMGLVARTINDSNGFVPLLYNDEDLGVDFILSKIALIHSEVSEMVEELRIVGEDKSFADRFAEEMVDVFVRILDLYTGMEARGFNLPSLADIYYKKMFKNSKRGYMHGKKA